MSPLPARPSRPERCSSVEASSEGGMPMCSSSQRISPGSSVPERVAITSPSSGLAASASAVIASLRNTSISAPKLPRHWTRL